MHLSDINWSASADSAFKVMNLFTPAGIAQTAIKSILPSGGSSNSGGDMQNTSDLNIAFDFTKPGLLQKLGLQTFDTTSPVIPDFLKSATNLNTTIQSPSPGAVALRTQQLSTPWYQNKTTMLIVGGVALVGAALFVFTGNKK